MGRNTESDGGRLTLALLDTLLQSAPVGLGFVDRELRFVRVNEKLAAMNGPSVEEHQGRRIDEVVPGLAHIVVPILERTLATGEASVDFDLTGETLAAPGDVRHWIASYYPVREADAPGAPVGVGVVIRDVTEERRAAEELDVRARHLEAVAATGQRALFSDDLDGLLRDGTETVAAILGVDSVHVFEHDPEQRWFQLRYAHNSPVPLGATVPDDPGTQPGWALEHRMPVVIPDMATETRFAPTPLAATVGAASAMTVVIRGPGRPFGVLSCFTRTRRKFRQEEVDFVQSMANVLGTAAARHKVDMALRAERERLRLALDAGGMGDWEWDIPSGRLSWSEGTERVFGLAPGSFGETYDKWMALVHPDDRAGVDEQVRAALESGDGEPFKIEFRAVQPGGAVHWVSGSGRVVRDEHGEAVGMIGVAADVTERMEAEYTQTLLFAAEQEARAEAEAARDRLAFLAEASEVLSSSLDYRSTLTQVAHLAVPRLADWCAVDVLDEDAGGPMNVVVAHADPAKVAMAAALRERWPSDPESEQGVGAVIRSGEPQIIPEVTDEMLTAAALDDEHLAVIRELGLRSALTVPLTARGRTLGALSLISAESERVYNDADLALATDLARRAALAIDNALLFRDRSDVADALQRALLPPSSPEIPGLEVAVRYRPVGRGTEIGGDFYDVFESAPGMWSVVIGDVCGKGTAAAAVTGLARDTIRGVSIRERSPRRVLSVLNEVLLRRDEDRAEVGRFLTVALARVETGAVGDDGAGGAGVPVRVACAGHPLPLVVRPGGVVEEAGKPALLLGLFTEVDPVDVDVLLTPGSAMVFFTDGVIEQHGPEGMFGEDRLRALLASVGPADAEMVAQSVLDAIAEFAPGPRQDDVAVVVLRVPSPGGVTEL